MVKSRFGIIGPAIAPSSVNGTRASTFSEFTFGDIDEQFAYKNLRELKTNKAIGLDRVNACLLKDSANVLTPVLTNLFNRSLSSSIYPDICKCGKVTSCFV